MERHEFEKKAQQIIDTYANNFNTGIQWAVKNDDFEVALASGV